MAEQFYGLTDTGKERSNNEDTFIAQTSAHGRFVIACVIDGVGGYAGGEVAAALAREAILQRLEKPVDEVIPALLECFNLASEKIAANKLEHKRHQSMACVATLALVDIEQNQFHYAHVGDTRLYLLRDGSLVKITQDHSFVGFMEDSGRLTEEAAMAHPKRNEINKALGFEPNLAKQDDYIETGHSPFLPGDMLLICSDGLTDMVPKEGISQILTAKASLTDKCEALINAANQYGGKDNVTAVLVKHDRASVNYQATKPAASQKKTEVISKPTGADPAAIDHVELNSNPPKKRTNLLWLILLIVAAIGVGVWQYTIHNQPAPPPQQQTPVQKPVNDLQHKLQTAIDSLKGNLLTLTNDQFKSPIVLSRPITINRDTLFIKTKGDIVLQADSNYTGAAMEISQSCKLVFLDSLTFKNFRIGIIGHDNSLHLKSVRFNACDVPLQNKVSVPNNKYVSGTITTLKPDSLPVKPKGK